MTAEDELARAQAGIARLERELERLRGSAEDERFVRELRSSLTQAAAAGRLSASRKHSALLEETVRTAMHVLHASAGSLYLVDEAGEELIFEVALGARAQTLLGQRIPLGHGIAGWVAATGQAIAVADAQKDPRWAEDVANAVGFSPKAMLTVPLFVDDRTIGVMQVLDKQGGEPFGAGDMETLGYFANQAAIAIEQSQRLGSLQQLVSGALAGITSQGGVPGLSAAAATFVQRTEQDTAYAQTVELAGMLAEIARRGDSERRLCLELVSSILAYLRRDPRAGA